jgi:hypothetical protein
MVSVVCSNYCDEFQQRMPVGLLLGLLSVIPEDLWVKRLGKDYIWQATESWQICLHEFNL